MDTLAIIIIVVAAMVILGLVLGLSFARRNVSEKFHKDIGPEYDRTVQTMGGEKKAQTELNERHKHVKTLDIRPLSVSERYLAEWTAAQSKFVDGSGKAIIDADRLIIEVMQLRGYPASDFGQRAADISINHPTLVSNYRGAREISIKNRENKADTEALRQALIYYRSLFDELRIVEPVVIEEKKR